MAVGIWNIQPSEFWDQTPQEWWWVYDAKVPRKTGLSPQDVERYRSMLGKRKDDRTRSN